MPPHERRLKHGGPFHDLLIEACPPQRRVTEGKQEGSLVYDANGVKSINLLAELIGMNPWGVRLWIKRSKMPALRAMQISKLPHQQIPLAAFSPYVYG